MRLAESHRDSADESHQACSEGLRAKYPRSQSLRAMLVDDVLPTTLKLVPA